MIRGVQNAVTKRTAFGQTSNAAPTASDTLDQGITQCARPS
jgi:hypothetical protein